MKRAALKHWLSLAIACCAVAAWPSAQPLQAQAVATDPAVQAGEKTDPPQQPPANIEEAKPELFFLRDEDGNLVLVPNFSFEEYERLYKLGEGLIDPDPPAFSFQQIRVDGTAQQRHAELDVTVQFRVTGSRSGHIAVPLRFNNAMLRPPVEYEGPGDQFVEYTPTSGYVCWVQAKENTEHTLRLKMVAGLLAASGQNRLALALPEARTNLTLRVPLDRVEAVVKQNDRNLLAPPEPLEGGHTALSVEGLGGDFELDWREGVADVIPVAPVLSSNASITVKIDAQHYVTSEATLELRSFGGELESFDVRLPPGTRLVSREQTGYQVEPLSPASGLPDNGQRVRVTLDRKTDNSGKIVLLAELIRPADQEAVPFEAAGFEVIGARHQKGELNLVVTGDWSVRPVSLLHMRRVSELSESTPPPQQQRSVARYTFFSQPCSLMVQVLPPETRIHIEPVYVLHVGKDQVRLDARLQCKVRGAKAYGLDVDLEGWQVDQLRPDSLVLNDVSTKDVSPLTIPLSGLAKTPAGEFDLRILAHQEIAEDQQRLSLSLPRPQASSTSPASDVVTLAPATVVVVPNDNVELLPEADEMQGLVEDTLITPPEQLELPQLQRAPLVYRISSADDEARFVSQYRIVPGTVTVALAHRIDAEARTLQVTQRFGYRITYEARTHLLLDVPETALSRASSLAITLEDETALPHTLLGEASEGRQRIQVNLLEKRIGPCELVLQYTLPITLAGDDEKHPLTVPLALPAAEDITSITGNSLRIAHLDSMLVDVQDGDWTLRETPSDDEAGNGDQREYASSVTPPTVPLILSTAVPHRNNSTVVQKTYHQTWITRDRRRDRAAFRLVTTQKQIEVQLPPGARTSLEEVVVGVEGRRVETVTISDEGVLRVDVSATPPGEEITVEIWYQVELNRLRWGRTSFTLPEVLGANRIERLYWQLALPRTEMLISGPVSLTPELSWRWQGLYWGRRASLSQRQLENWIGASHQMQLPQETNQYLFTSFGGTATFTILTASRWLVVFTASGILLATGLLAIYISQLRHPAALFAAGLILCGASIVYPEPALMVAQAASLGLLLVLSAKLLGWVIARRRLGRHVIRGASYAGSDSQSTELQVPVRETGSHASTATSPVAVQLPAAEPKP